MTANSYPNDTAGIVSLHCSLSNEYAMTFPMAIPCMERKTPCEYFNETMMRPDAGSTALTGTEHLKLISAVPTCATFLMRDTCAAEASDETAPNDTAVVTVQLVTEPHDPARGNVGKSHFHLRDGRKLQVQQDEGDVSFPTLSIGEVFAGCQAMWPGLSGELHTTRETDSNAIKLEKHQGVYWLSDTGTEPLNGDPLCPNPETASTVVQVTAISDTTAMQSEESEETR